LDVLQGPEEQRPAVSQPVQAPIAVPKLIRCLLMTFELHLGHQGFNGPEILLS